MAASERRLLRILNELTLSDVGLESVPALRTDALANLRAVLAWDNVVGVGIAEKVVKGRSAGTLALTFYVREKVEKADLTADRFVPPALPEVLSGPQVVDTDVVEVGELRPQTHVTRDPVQPGFSIGHFAVSAGTLGAVVRSGLDLFALSNSHVLARSGLAQVGDTILYPGASDGGNDPTDKIGQLHDFVPFQTGGAFINRMDAAVCKLTANALQRLRPEIVDLNIRPQGLVRPQRNMEIVKVGSATDKTEGQVKDVNFRFKMPYPGVGDVGFLDQALCTPYATGGDSGALVLEKNTLKAAGLHFAGSAQASVFSPIGEVLQKLGVQLVP